MIESHGRRAFLLRLAHRLSAMGLAAPTVSALGCSLEEIQRGAEEVGATGLTITRPVLLPLTDGAVRIASPLSRFPAAYVSRPLRKVYVDVETRLEARMILAAHISVSTGHWRIPLPGDDLAIPVDAGDELREFEERPIGEWDPAMVPAEGDFRVRRGHRETVRIAFGCLPMADREGWFSAGPWDIGQCRDGSGRDLCREVLMDVGTGSHYSQRSRGACAEPTGTVRFVTWVTSDA